MQPPYSFMHTLGFGAQTVISMSDDSNLTMSFATSTDLKNGTFVKITGEGTVGPVTAVTDIPLGIVISSSEVKGEKRVVVQTPFQMLVKGQASGAVTVGNNLDAEAFDIATELMKYKAHAAGNFIVGVALSTAATTEAVAVGVLRVPYKQ